MTTQTKTDRGFRLTKATPEIWLGNGSSTSRASWDLLLDGRRVAHIFHNGDEWTYRLDANPYVQYRGGRATRNDVVAEIKQVVSENPANRDFWLSGTIEGKSHWLETKDGPLAFINAVDWGSGDVWVVTMTFGDLCQEFRWPGEAVEWAVRKALRWQAGR